jgi:hypothetical protein
VLFSYRRRLYGKGKTRDIKKQIKRKFSEKGNVRETEIQKKSLHLVFFLFFLSWKQEDLE